VSRALEAAKVLRSGSCPADERWFYHNTVKLRAAALEEDEPMFGLTPHEQVELALLKRVLADEEASSINIDLTGEER
jgi:hypothetical protein